MEIGMILHKLRDDGRLRNFENNFRELQQMISVLGRTSPFVGRILTKEKMYSGKIKKLKLNNSHLEFTIIDSDKNGETDGNSKTYQEKIPLENLEDIQTWYKKGKLLSLDDLLNDHKMEEENE